MSKADLHVHSSYSEHPADWFLQRLGAGESYTDPIYIYTKMKEQDMDFVTITDHNRIDGALLLKEKYPNEVFVSVESTAYFPEDNCKVHILIYDISEQQFEMIEEKRTNIYELRDYLKEEKIIHSVAHATYSVNGLLKLHHLEKLLLLFDVFESINGGRNPINNLSWTKVLENLTPEKIKMLEEKHKIQPFSETPWIKGITGGSDDHAGLFLGKTYTSSMSETMSGFLNSIRNKKTAVSGRHNDYKSLAFMVYKIAIEFSKSKSKVLENTFFSELTDLIYNGKTLSFKRRIKFSNYNLFQNSGASDEDNIARKVIYDLVNGLQKLQNSPREVRLDFTFKKLSQLIDTYFTMLFISFEKHIMQVDIMKIFQNISSTLPGIFLAIPFFSTLKVMFSNREIINKMEIEFGTLDHKKRGSILWFTDTISDLNGVSVSLQKVIKLSSQKDLPIKVISSVSSTDVIGDEPRFIDLPVMHSFKLPYYENQKLVVPSPLGAIDIIHDLNPSKIIISTPGPVGLLGLLAARLFNVPVIGVYHTDFKAQLSSIMKEGTMAETIGKGVIWFYSQLDEVYAPSEFYMEILAERGIDRQKIKLLPRGVDFSIFDYDPEAREKLENNLSIKEGFYLIYTGRLSDDKKLDIVLNAMKEIKKSHNDIYLILVGDGPQREEYQKKHNDPHVIFIGKVDRYMLKGYLSAADLFVFPSTTDTFGMSVLEAQACYLPALVTIEGGPQEIIEDGETGFIIPELSVKCWVEKIIELYEIHKNTPEEYLKLKKASRDRAIKIAGWDKFFNVFLNYEDKKV